MIKKHILTAAMAMLILSGCGNVTNREMKTTETGNAETDFSAEDTATEENNSGSEDTLNEETTSDKATNYEDLTSDELLDLFVDGKIEAYRTEDGTSFYMTDLPSDPDDPFEYYWVGDKVDLDNDGENELIINGPYGGIYLDARDGQVYVLNEEGGATFQISYTEFDEKTWIVHSDTTHAGRIRHDFTLYDGSGNVVDSFNLYKEFWSTPEVEDGPDTVYIYRDEEITKDEYDELRMKMLGY